MAIRFVHVFDADQDARRLAEVQRIFRSYFGGANGAYAEGIPELLRRPVELGHRTIIITAEDPRGSVLAFAMAFHYTDINATLLDYIVVDPAVRQRGIGGALYEAHRGGRTEGEPYVVFDALGGERVPAVEEVRDIVHALLFRKYGFAPDDEYARGVLASVGERPVALQPPRSRSPAPRAPTAHGVFAPCKVVVTDAHRLHHVRERGYVERPARVDRILRAIETQPGVEVLPVVEHGDAPITHNAYFAGFADERGAGEGYNHNLPLPEGVGDDAYLEVLGQALALVRQFAPAALVLSVGFDIAKGDPTGAWTISPDDFERIGGAIAALGLPTLAVQEGGYDTRTIGRNARQLLAGLQRGIHERRAEPRFG